MTIKGRQFVEEKLLGKKWQVPRNSRPGYQDCWHIEFYWPCRLKALAVISDRAGHPADMWSYASLIGSNPRLVKASLKKTSTHATDLAFYAIIFFFFMMAKQLTVMDPQARRNRN